MCDISRFFDLCACMLYVQASVEGPGMKYLLTYLVVCAALLAWRGETASAAGDMRPDDSLALSSAWTPTHGPDTDDVSVYAKTDTPSPGKFRNSRVFRRPAARFKMSRLPAPSTCAVTKEQENTRIPSRIACFVPKDPAHLFAGGVKSNPCSPRPPTPGTRCTSHAIHSNQRSSRLPWSRASDPHQGERGLRRDENHSLLYVQSGDIQRRDCLLAA